MVKFYYIIDAMLKYIYTVITVRLSKEKVALSIDDRHRYYMDKYHQIYSEYDQAMSQYKSNQYASSYKRAQSATQRFDALKEEIRVFRADHRNSRQYIQRGCRRMESVFNEPDHCNMIFPRHKEDSLAWVYS